MLSEAVSSLFENKIIVRKLIGNELLRLQASPRDFQQPKHLEKGVLCVLSTTRRQRQKAKKKRMQYCEEAIAKIIAKEEYDFPLINSFGYKDPVARQACTNIQRTHYNHMRFELGQQKQASLIDC